jgi:hypothetical protein
MHGWALARRSAISASVGYARVSTGLLPDQFAGGRPHGQKPYLREDHFSGSRPRLPIGNRIRSLTVLGRSTVDY